MRFTLAASWFNIDVTLFETSEDEKPEPPQPVVAGAQPDLWPVGPTADPLQQVDEQGDRARRRRTGFTS